MRHRRSRSTSATASTAATARAEPRLDFTKHIGADGAVANGAAPPAAAANASGPQWNPIAAVGAIAILGVMLMLGVLIGNKDNEATVAAAPATTTTAAPVAAAPTDTAAADAAKGKGGKDAPPRRRRRAPAGSRAARARPRASRPTIRSRV